MSQAEEWTDGQPDGPTDEEETDEARVTQMVQHLVKLAGDADARQVLGVDGTLEDNLDVMFVADPLAWLANDIAQAIRLEEDETEAVSLSSVVGCLRLYQALQNELDQPELVEAVLEYLEEEPADDGL